jgi:hypothetical protein
MDITGRVPPATGADQGADGPAGFAEVGGDGLEPGHGVPQPDDQRGEDTGCGPARCQPLPGAGDRQFCLEDRRGGARGCRGNIDHASTLGSAGGNAGPSRRLERRKASLRGTQKVTVMS